MEFLTNDEVEQWQLFQQSEGVTEVKTKGSPAARKREVSTKLIQHYHAYKFDTFTRRIQRHVRIYSYKQVRVYIYTYTYIRRKRRSRQKLETMKRIAANREYKNK